MPARPPGMMTGTWCCLHAIRTEVMFLITHVSPGRSGRATGSLSASHGPNTPQPDEVTFPAGRNWCQRDLRPDLIRLDKRTFVVFIQDAPGQKRVEGHG